MVDNNTTTNIQRRTVLQSIGAVATASAVAPLVQGRESYPVVDHDRTDLPVEDLIIDAASDPQIAEHPNHDRIALATTGFDQGFELYLATGVQSISDVPSEVLQITSDTAVGVLDLNWKSGNRLEFWRDGSVFELKLPPSNKMFSPEKSGERQIPNTVQEHRGDE